MSDGDDDVLLLGCVCEGWDGMWMCVWEGEGMMGCEVEDVGVCGVGG